MQSSPLLTVTETLERAHLNKAFSAIRNIPRHLSVCVTHNFSNRLAPYRLQMWWSYRVKQFGFKQFKIAEDVVTTGCFLFLSLILNGGCHCSSHFTPVSVTCFRQRSLGCVFALPVSEGFVGPVLYRPNTSSHRGVIHLSVFTASD